MKHKDFKDYLKELKLEEKNYSDTKDNQSYIYIYQITDLLFNELMNLVLDQKCLYNITYNSFRKNIDNSFKNIKDYIDKIKKSKEKDIDDLLKLSLSNNYIDLKNLNNIYDNFKNEIIKDLDIEKKIITTLESTIDIYKANIYNSTVILKKDILNKVIESYRKLYINELLNNLNFKKNNILMIYKNFINNVLKDIREEKLKIKTKNLSIISNVSYDYLKKKEYSIIDKYIKNNRKIINESFSNFDIWVKEKHLASKKKKKTNTCKEYLLDFNATMSDMIKNVFDEMNDIVSLDNDKIRSKLKDFNELTTHIFSLELVFDKQFSDYKGTFLIKNSDKFNNAFEKNRDIIINNIKKNIFSIFRENINIYNDIIYKTMLLKSKIGEYDSVLNVTKVKDLLLE